MAYVDQFANRNRTGPITAVLAIHAGIGYLLVIGLGAEFTREIIADFEAVEFPVKPPEVDDPPLPVSEPVVEQKVQVPTPPLDLTKPLDLQVEPADLPPIDDLVPRQLPKPLPGPSATPGIAFDPAPPKPRNDPGRWVTTDDYPASEARRGSEGTARFRLEIAANGTVESCTIIRSSGSSRLDTATCRNIERRAKFSPARDATDQPVAGTYENAVRWVLPD